ncbi:MAG TPA: methyltransferase domain-containing protein [Candidatus Saccharimonadales bacterium]
MSNDADKVIQKVDRAGFVTGEFRNKVDLDVPLPIGFGQTISQPTTVAHMLEWLAPEPGDRVLDVGSGSGWTTALLGELVGREGEVYAVERIPELVAFGEQNCARFGIANAKFFQAGRHYGLPEYAPYDKILVSAAAKTLPTELLSQLGVNSTLVIPVQSDILEIIKLAADKYETREHGGFVFVPLESTPLR